MCPPVSYSSGTPAGICVIIFIFFPIILSHVNLIDRPARKTKRGERKNVPLPHNTHRVEKNL